MSVPITNGTGVSSVAAELIGTLQYQQIKLVDGRVGSSSVLTVNNDGSINASIIGSPTVTFSGSPSISGAVTVVGNPSVSGTVGASIVGQLPAGNAVIGAVAASISGLVNISGSVVGFQGGTQITSVSGLVNVSRPVSSLVSGVTSILTGTSSVLVLAAAPASQRNYVTQMLVTNGSATGTFVDVVDNGSVIYSGYAAASGGGFSATFSADSPLKQPTSVLALYVAPRAQASIIAAMSGYTAT